MCCLHDREIELERQEAREAFYVARADRDATLEQVKLADKAVAEVRKERDQALIKMKEALKESAEHWDAHKKMGIRIYASPLGCACTHRHSASFRCSALHF